ncbi:uncharacterized protein J3R85_006262 [Psidium guajava]|nr:uncharacterized protein J3R85_006262 [Psidium guajava]
MLKFEARSSTEAFFVPRSMEEFYIAVVAVAFKVQVGDDNFGGKFTVADAP